ncbi:hypothetical protein V1508DRAFT_400450 [Lipomyces doorenjongii]|uniref:uncharacterized protein n=1 Tax=Lipomyces doorenjongii TaxID=383834 RepID=UPI0034CF2BC4
MSLLLRLGWWVIVIGAGISGIIAGIRFPQRIPNLDLAIYDKNPDVEGVCSTNSLAHVHPAHSYQLSFDSNPNWSQFYASGQEIHQYWKAIVQKYGVDKYVRLNSKIVEARFDQAEAKWQVKIQRVDTGEVFTDSANILYGCVGALNEWKWPDIKGLHDFKGVLLHSANWDDDWDPTGKAVAVIGSGSSAVQIVPSLQPIVKQRDAYVRSKTWISPPSASGEVQKQEETNFTFSEEEVKRFNEGPQFFLEYRKAIDQELQSLHHITFRGSNADATAAYLNEHMMKKLTKKPEILQKLCLTSCRAAADNVSFISEEISSITAGGVVTNDDILRPVDAIICATGFDTTWTGRFPIIGRGGRKLADKWAEYPETYLSVATDEFPNMFISLGPNSEQGTGSLSIVIEKIGEYVCAAVEKIQRECIKTMTVKRASVESFVEFCDQHFPKTVFSLPCMSWYKRGTSEGRVSGMWPGSSLHFITTLANPRWEDYEYEYVNDNVMAWLGDGFTEAQKIPEAERAYYLDPVNIDFPKPMRSSTEA